MDLNWINFIFLMWMYANAMDLVQNEWSYFWHSLKYKHNGFHAKWVIAKLISDIRWSMNTMGSVQSEWSLTLFLTFIEVWTQWVPCEVSEAFTLMDLVQNEWSYFWHSLKYKHNGFHAKWVIAKLISDIRWSMNTMGSVRSEWSLTLFLTFIEVWTQWVPCEVSEAFTFYLKISVKILPCTWSV